MRSSSDQADNSFTPEILPPLLDCYARSQQMERAEAFLLDILERYQGVSPVLALAVCAATRRRARCRRVPDRALRQRPSVRG